MKRFSIRRHKQEFQFFLLMTILFIDDNKTQKNWWLTKKDLVRASRRTRIRSNYLFSSDKVRSAFLIFFLPSLCVYLTSCFFHSNKSSFVILSSYFFSVTSIDTMNNANSNNNSTLVLLDNIATQDLLSKAKVCCLMIYVYQLYFSFEMKTRFKCQTSVMRIILHNTSLA